MASETPSRFPDLQVARPERHEAQHLPLPRREPGLTLELTDPAHVQLAEVWTDEADDLDLAIGEVRSVQAEEDQPPVDGAERLHRRQQPVADAPIAHHPAQSEPLVLAVAEPVGRPNHHRVVRQPGADGGAQCRVGVGDVATHQLIELHRSSASRP